MLVVAPLKLELSSDAMQMQPMLVAGGWMLPVGPLKLELSLLPYNVMTMLVTPLYIYISATANSLAPLSNPRNGPSHHGPTLPPHSLFPSQRTRPGPTLLCISLLLPRLTRYQHTVISLCLCAT
jgi:hypothetical protein